MGLIPRAPAADAFPTMADEAPAVPLRPRRVTANISTSVSDGKGVARDAEVRAFDRELARRAKRGDRGAFEQLYRLHHAAVFRLARFHLGADAEDATSETFVRAWAALPRYEDTGAPFVAWLYGIARHVVTDEFRRRGRVEPRSELPDRMIDFRVDDRLDLRAAIDRLPEEQRVVIELKFLADMKNPEIASLLGTTTGAVNAKQWRALNTLNEILAT
jgi:RNA polymerase sigma-70 factor (ECF subfamily)